MRPGTLTVRAVALLAAGSAAIHQLRYAIGYGDEAGHALAAHPHGYLAFALPVVVALLVLVMAAALMRVAHGRPATGALRFRNAWLWAALALALIYGAQESIEGASAVADGGWIGLALALPAGFLVALALAGSSAAPAIAARLPRLALANERVVAAHRPITLAARPARAGARAPPLSSVV